MKTQISKFIYIVFLLTVLLVSKSVGQVYIDKTVTTADTYSEYIEQNIKASGSDNVCNSGTQVDFEVSGSVGMGLVEIERMDGTDGPHRVKVKINWLGCQTGTLNIAVSYRRKEHQGWGDCDWESWTYMYTYRITRTNTAAPTGVVSGINEITASDIENSPAVFSLSFVPNLPYNESKVTQARYWNGNENVIADVQKTGPNSNYIALPITYYAHTFGTHNLQIDVLNSCGFWLPLPPVPLVVKPTCYAAYNTPVSISVTGASPPIVYDDQSVRILPNALYTLVPNGYPDFDSHYQWVVADGGQDISLNENNFTVTAELGSYLIEAQLKPGRDCPVPDPVRILVISESDGDMLVLDQKCPIVFPEDLPDFGYLIGADNFVLQHFAVTARSERSITVKPGITLELGAELILDLPEPTPDLSDPTKHYVETIAYDEYHRVVGATRNYFNSRGLSVQTQSKNLEGGVILATETLYDVFNRPVIQTLSAPVSATNEPEEDECGESIDPNTKTQFGFKDQFVKADASTSYSATHFDLEKENAPDPVYANEEGTLGWYYSLNNGTSENDVMNEPLVAATSYPYSRTIFHHDGTNQLRSITKPGDAFKAGGNFVPSSIQEAVEGNDPYLNQYLTIRQTELSLVHGAIEGNYVRTVVTDNMGKVSVVYSNREGNTLISLYFGKPVGEWTAAVPVTKSYQFYDLAGRLKVSVSPNGVQQFERLQNPVPFANIDKTTYYYNARGQVEAIEEPDTYGIGFPTKGISEFLYRKDGKIRFSQNAKQRIASDQLDVISYSYTHYDDSGRPIESGEYIPFNQFLFKGQDMKDLIEKTGPEGDFGNIGQKRNVLYSTYNEPAEGLPSDRVQRFISGAVSQSRLDNHITSSYSYDERGRVEWIVQNINGLGVKTIDYRYGPTGAVQEVLYQKGQPDQFTHFYQYDANGRLLKAFTSTAQLDYNKQGEIQNPGSLQLQATYYYYLHGPLKRIELAGNLQGIDYLYTADGMLKSINNSNPSNQNDPGKDGVSNGFRNDVFGMTLQYFNQDYNSHDNPLTQVTLPNHPEHHSGLIQANRWHSPIEPSKEFTYAFTYDERNQFSTGDWGTINAGAFVPNVVSGYKENISGYDLNGNINALTRTNSLGVNVADYHYEYIANTNKLDRIVTGNNSLVKDYEYNEIGELKSETGVAGTRYIEYNSSGKLSAVFSDNNKQNKIVEYTYDDRGFRLTKTAYEEGVAKLRTWYVRDASGSVMATYEQPMAPQATAQVTEMPVYGSGRIGLYKPEFNHTLYELSDHLGNVRAVIGPSFTEEFLATMETERQTDEQINLDGEFSGIQHDPTSADINHTPGVVEVQGISYNISNPNEVLRMNNMPINGSPTPKVGTGISRWVHPGDKIEAEVFVKYTDFNDEIESPLPLLANYLTAAFTTAPIIDGLSIFSPVESPSFMTFPCWQELDDEQPRAFLNILFFDRNGKLLHYHFDQVTSEAKIVGSSAHERLFVEYTPEKEGFLYVFLSNHANQNTEVYFDDLRLTHTYSNIVGGSDFYPFGLTIEDRQISREFYRHGYQGQFSEKDEETGWNHFLLREYDPIIGRWTIADPKKAGFSPYWGMNNDPVNKTDPDGGCPGGCPPTTPSFMRSALKSSSSLGGLQWKASMGIGLGFRSKTMMGGGAGFDVGVDAVHVLVFTGNQRSGIQKSYGVGSFNFSTNGQNYSGVEAYVEREIAGPGYGQKTREQFNYNNPVTGNSGTSDEFIDETPSTNVDAVFVEVGAESNWFQMGLETFKNYILDMVPTLRDDY